MRMCLVRNVQDGYFTLVRACRLDGLLLEHEATIRGRRQ